MQAAQIQATSFPDWSVERTASAVAARVGGSVDESDSCTKLFEAFAAEPAKACRNLADVTLALCEADSAGVELLSPDPNNRVFQWAARAGTFADEEAADVPFEASPAALALLHNDVLLLRSRDRKEQTLRDVGRPAREILVAPLYINSEPAGVLWVILHQPHKSFDEQAVNRLRKVGRIGSTGLELMARLSEARQKEESHQAFVAQVRDYAIFSMAADGSALTWNEGVESVLGYGRDEFIGSPVELPFLPEDIEAGIPWRELETARTNGSASDDRWLRRKDGRSFFAVGRTTRLTDATGRCVGFTKVLRDETQRVLAEEGQRESQARFRSLVNNVRDYAIFLIDPNGFITEWTEGAGRVTGYSAGESLGKHLSLFYTAEDVATGEVSRELRAAAASGRIEREGWRIRKGGERFWVNEIATAVRTHDGKLLGFTKISRDLTERKKAEEALLEADQRKDEFLATLAHELRNPLAPLRNGLQIVRLISDGETRLQRTVDVMDRQLSHLKRLVDDLLDVARITSGKLDLHREELDLREVLSASVELSKVAIDARRHQLVVEPVREPVLVKGDFDRLTQVFSNLLSNAAKYTEPGGRVAVTMRTEDNRVNVSIADTGIGIADADLPHVFDLFSQVRAHQEQAQPGLGIGLSLVQRLVQMHDGSVTASSDGPGKGSTFRVSLPLRTAVSAVSETRDADPVMSKAPRRRILVADDNIDAAASLATLLELQGHEVVVAHDGQEAVMKTGAFSPEVIFLDLGMPRLSGIDAARQVRSLPQGKDIMLVALTGWGQQADRDRTRRAGFDLHLVKPVDPEALGGILTSLPPTSRANSAKTV
jgi:PAS domain S-box-containing protein